MKRLIAFLVFSVAIMALIECSERSVDEQSSADPAVSSSKFESVRDSLDPVKIPPRHFLPGVPYRIGLSAIDHDIEVGGDYTYIYATLFDIDGHPVGEGFILNMEITAAPTFDSAGPSFSRPPSDSILHSVSVRTDDSGTGSAVIYSGTVTGTIRIRASWRENNDIFIEKPLLKLIPGPPAMIILDPSNLIQPYGDSLIMGICGTLLDEYTNLVEPEGPIIFGVIPDSAAIVFEDTSYSCAFLLVACESIFDTLYITASYDDLADTTGPISIGLYEGDIIPKADPDSILAVQPGECDSSIISARLLSGMDCPVGNGIIIFRSHTYGEIAGPWVDTTNADGYAFCWYQICYDEIPEDPGSCIGIAKARLVGYPDVETQAEIFCSRSD